MVSVAALALFVAGCSGSKSSAGSSTSTTLLGRPGHPSGTSTSTTPPGQLGHLAHPVHVDAPSPCVLDPGVTRSAINIGVIATRTGPDAAAFADSISGLEARVARANQTREIGSRRINLVVRDDAGSASENSSQARDLLEKSNVWMVVELSSASAGSAPYLAAQGIPVTGWQAGSSVWSTDANMFTFRLPSTADPTHVHNDRDATIMKKAGVTKAALIGDRSPESAAFLAGSKAALKSVGIAVVYDNEKVPAATTDFATEAARIKTSGADGVVSALAVPATVELSTELRRDRVALDAMLFPGGYDPRLLSRPGMRGALIGLEFKPFESNPPAYEAFNASLPRGAIRDAVSYIGWLSGEITLQGIKDAGAACPTRKAFIPNLRLEHAYAGGGAFDPVDLEAGFGSDFACEYYVKVVNRQFAPQSGGVQQCGQTINF